MREYESSWMVVRSQEVVETIAATQYFTQSFVLGLTKWGLMKSGEINEDT